MNLIDKIKSPTDLKMLDIKQLVDYADEVREFIILSVEKNGGHLASNLGSVDFIIAMHYVFDCPIDKFIFDVGHQAYVHKIITGRKDGFDNLRHTNGVSGFVNSSESEFDCCTMGHSSTSLSIGLGYVRARDIRGENYSVVSVIGDGSFTGGEAFEALNNIGTTKSPMIIILNDNTMSISKNVGSIAKRMAKFRLSKNYVKFKHMLKNGLNAMPILGKSLIKLCEKIRDFIKQFFISNKLFEEFGIKYLGPFDGHDIKTLIEIFKSAKNFSSPVLIHILTKKGKGCCNAEKNPTLYHGITKKQDTMHKSFSKIFKDKIVDLADKYNNVVAITAAMSNGTGLDKFAESFPNRFFDVGIAEQHAISLASGFSRGGMYPVVAIYSTFLQRAYDQLITDLCIDNLPCLIAIDHSGYVDGDGVTHQGIFDNGYLTQIPNLIVMSPKDGNELNAMIDFAYLLSMTVAIKYPKSYNLDFGNSEAIKLGKWEVMRENGEVVILATSAKAVDLALKIDNATIVNARFIKPLDYDFLNLILDKNIITIEDSLLRGGFGESVLSYLNSKGYRKVFRSIGYKDKFITAPERKIVDEENGFTKENIISIINFMNKNA